MQQEFVYSHSMLNELAKKCQEISNSKGFTTTWEDINTKLLLIHTEISEAAEEVRAGRRETYYSLQIPASLAKPEGFPIELADAIIRILEMSSSLGIDIQKAVTEKMAYNETRPHKHGKRY